MTTRDEFFDLYKRAGILTDLRRRKLDHAWPEVERTWDLLLSDKSADVFALATESQDGLLSSSCGAMRHTEDTCTLQHWLSARNQVTSHRAILNLLQGLSEGAGCRYFRTVYHPRDLAALRLFRSLRELTEGKYGEAIPFASFQVHIQEQDESETGWTPASPEEVAAASASITRRYGPLPSAVEGLDTADVHLTKLTERYKALNLMRRRVMISLQCSTGGSPGLLIIDMYPPGISMQGRNGRAFLLSGELSFDTAVLATALRVAAAIFRKDGTTRFTLLADPALVSSLAEAGAEPSGMFYWAGFDLHAAAGKALIQHLRVYCEARVGIVKIVAALSDEELDWILERGQRRVFRSGEVLIREGDASDFLMLLQSGEVTIMQGKGADRKQVAICATPDVIGEVGVLKGIPRTASVVALSSVIALEIPRTLLHDFFRGFPAGGRVLKKALDERMKHDVQVARIDLQATRDDTESLTTSTTQSAGMSRPMGGRS